MKIALLEMDSPLGDNPHFYVVTIQSNKNKMRFGSIENPFPLFHSLQKHHLNYKQCKWAWITYKRWPPVNGLG